MLRFSPEGKFTTQLIFQPIPMLFAQQSLKNGGSVLDLERNMEDGIPIQINSITKTRAEENFAHPKVS
jgi:hypothetical protein